MDTVFGMISRLGPLRSLGGYRDVLKRVLTRVDFPRPDSPIGRSASKIVRGLSSRSKHTNHHDVEVEAFTDALSMPLIRKICESNVTSKFPAHNVSHVTGGLSCSLRIFGANCLGDALPLRSHWVAALDVRCNRLAVRYRWPLRLGSRRSP